jgi:hypothetical protein
MTRARRRAASAGVFWASVALGSHADAQPAKEPVRLSWVRASGADACSTEPEIAAQVARKLGRSPFAADATKSVEALVAHEGRGWRAEIHVRSRDGGLIGSRDLTSEAQGCAGIEAAAVLAIVLAIDPDALTNPPSQVAPDGSRFTPPPSVAPSPPPSVPRALVSPPLDVPFPLPAWVPPEPSAPPPEREGLGPRQSSIALRVGAGIGLLPRVGVALALAGHVGVARSVQLVAEALWMPEVHTTDKGFSFGLAAGALGACLTLVQVRRVDFAACASLWAGALHSVVYVLAPVSPGERPWGAAEASPLLRVRLADHLHLELGVHVLVPLVRSEFTVTGFKDPVFQESVVTAAPFGGIGAHFP